jgi:hypothetical protein
MPTLEDAAAIALSLPEVTEGLSYRNRTWYVAKKSFCWDRPLGKADLKRLGDEKPPQGPILAVRVTDLGEKDAVLAEGRKGFFTIEHFNGYPAVLIELRLVGKRALREAIIDAWSSVAPARLAKG